MSHITLQHARSSEATLPHIPTCLENTKIKICLLVFGLLLSIAAILGHIYHVSAVANYALGVVGGVLILTALVLFVVQRCLQDSGLVGQQRRGGAGPQNLQEQAHLHDLALQGDRAAIEEALANRSATSVDYLLHGATRGGHANLVTLLLSQGADPRNVSLYDILEYPALHIASLSYLGEKGYQVMEVLLQHDPTLVSTVTAQQTTALHLAANAWREPSSLTQKKVKLLLEKGADVNAVNSRQETPLHEVAAGFMGHDPDIAIIELLVHAGADTQAKNDGGYTAFQLAEQYHSDWYNRPEIQKRLQALM